MTMSSVQSNRETQSRIFRYSEEIMRLTPPKDISEEVLLQVYELLVENYWKEKGCQVNRHRPN